MLSPTNGQIPKYYSPVRHSTPGSKLPSFPFDLHVLGLPPAFNLSHDQTLQFKFFKARNPTTYFLTPYLKLFLNYESLGSTLKLLLNLKLIRPVFYDSL